MKKTMHTKNSRGFTLIEVMVATGIFVVVVTVGIGSVLSVTRAHRYTAEMRQAVDTLYFVMEDITRNARLGTIFRCSDQATAPQDCPLDSDGSSGSFTLAFTNYLAPRTDALYPNDPSYLYVYKIDPGQNGIGKITKSTSEGTLDMTPPSVDIDLLKSGFSVANASVYPNVTIRLAGTVNYQTQSIPFNIETTISPRTL